MVIIKLEIIKGLTDKIWGINTRKNQHMTNDASELTTKSLASALLSYRVQIRREEYLSLKDITQILNFTLELEHYPGRNMLHYMA